MNFAETLATLPTADHLRGLDVLDADGGWLDTGGSGRLRGRLRGLLWVRLWVRLRERLRERAGT